VKAGAGCKLAPAFLERKNMRYQGVLKSDGSEIFVDLNVHLETNHPVASVNLKVVEPEGEAIEVPVTSEVPATPQAVPVSLGSEIIQVPIPAMPDSRLV
jgi:hypothetical protein